MQKFTDIELYFSIYIQSNQISVVGEEAHHIMKVMRHKAGDEIYVTNGSGRIFKSKIVSTEKNEVKTEIKHTYKFENRLKNFTLCLPRLRVNDRFEFALEKAVELGFTNFVVFESARSIAKGDKSDRWKKIMTAAMKQSLRSYLPSINYFNSFEKLNSLQGTRIVFDQNADRRFNDYLNRIDKNKKQNLIFGPEGGLSADELKLLSGPEYYSLTENRLRAETAIITAASIISLA